MDGVVNIYKPEGPTSHDIVNRVRRLFGQKRVGHAGTLDPIATGVLVVCLGKATRIVEYLTDSEKEYRTTMTLGVRTDTEDATGQVTGEFDASAISLDAVKAAAARFVGEIEQIPPMISALKHQGKPLYKHAREGRTIERAPRRVRIHSIEVTDFRPCVHAEADMVVTCSSGTYIRTLCADIGDALGCAGMMSRLERTRVGVYRLEDAVTLEDMENDPPSHVTSISEALSDMPCIEVDSEDEWRIVHGLTATVAHGEPGTTVRVMSNQGLIAVGIVAEDGLSVGPRKVLVDLEGESDQ